MLSQALLSHHTSIGDVTQGTSYYITAGAEFGDEEYIWIGQAEIVAQPIISVSSQFLLGSIMICCLAFV